MTNLDGVKSNSDRLGVYQPPKRMSRLKKFVLFVVLAAFLGAAAWGTWNILKTNKIFTNKKNIFTRIGSLFISGDKPLVGEESGVVNVLLLGIGGEGHDGAYLTDTMIVASIRMDTKEVVLTSIPRDWLVSIPNHGGYNKINAVYAYSRMDNPNDPQAWGKAAIAAAEKVTGFTIPYYAEVDFKGFVKAVDHLGGLDITVDRSFSDSTFPNDFPFDTRGYLGTVTFYKGLQHMDGRTSLIFARSRHGTNDEGSDFARSERQKKILVALKDKMLGLNIGNLNTLSNLLSDFSDNFRTNLEAYELLRLTQLAKDFSGDNIYSLSLEPQGTLICDATIDQLTGKPYIRPAEPETDSNTNSTQGTTGNTTTNTGTTSGKTQTSGTTQQSTAPKTSVDQTQTTPATPAQIPMYIVQPCPGKTVTDVHNFLITYWDMARLHKEGATIEVQNSTGRSAAAQGWRKLAEEGLKVTFTTFPGKAPFERTIIYDNSKGSKPKTLEYLKEHFQLTPADVQYTNSKADFVVVLGSDSI